MQNMEDILKGLDVLGEIIDSGEEVPQEPVTPVEPVAQTVESEHIDHDSHFSWTHGFMFPVYGRCGRGQDSPGVSLRQSGPRLFPASAAPWSAA